MKTRHKVEKKEDMWFAWFPVRLDDDRICWFDKVKRTPIYANGFFMYYSYKDLTQDNK